jgi:tRNA(fMet)-specific endonuclease VapC
MLTMLDTNICIAVMKGHTGVRNRLGHIPVDQMAISSIVLAELSFGVSKSLHRAHNELALADFCAIIQSLDWPSQAAPIYGEIRAELESQGRLIGANDLLIAAHAHHLKAVLVTNNIREFERVPDLKLDNWLET